jgi:succinate dehydrogenase/fumarate reductase flavoprotein subunit
VMIYVLSGLQDGDSEGLDETSRTFERLVQRSALEEEVLLLQTRLEEELELRSVLESALSNVSGALTSFPHHLPIVVRSRIS